MDDLAYFDLLLNAVQLVALGMTRYRDADDISRRDEDSWLAVAFEATNRWRALGADGQTRWLVDHEGCGCPEVLRAVLATVDRLGAGIRDEEAGT